MIRGRYSDGILDHFRSQQGVQFTPQEQGFIRFMAVTGVNPPHVVKFSNVSESPESVGINQN